MWTQIALYLHALNIFGQLELLSAPKELRHVIPKAFHWLILNERNQQEPISKCSDIAKEKKTVRKSYL